MKKNIVITGAGKGLGLELVRLYANDKEVHIIAVCHSITDDLAAVSGITIKCCELTDINEINALFTDFDEHIDILYNVAGLYYEDQRDSIDYYKCMKMYSVNALAPLGIMEAALPYMDNSSYIVNVSSEAGSIGECQRNAEYGYCMSKSALNMASVIFHNKTGIPIMLYHPGWMRTAMGGERAAHSPYSISAEESARALIKLGQPTGINYIDYQGKLYQW